MSICISERSIETKEDKLRSILAQLEFKYQVLEYEERGVPFKTHLYVPEVHPGSGLEYHEREDDAHVLKVLYMHIIIPTLLHNYTVFIENSNCHPPWRTQ